MAGLVLRNDKCWHLRMRVPRQYRPIEKRGEITRSLKTGCRKEALVRMPAAEAIVLADLDARLAVGAARKDHDTELFSAAVAMAATRGAQYKPAVDVAQEPLEQILSRLDQIGSKDGPEVAKAMLGGVEAPSLMLSELVAEIERISSHDNRFKSEEQMRLWRNPRLRAVTNLTTALGEDRPVLSIDAAAARRHKQWWQERRAKEDQSHETANKDFSNMGSMLARYYDSLDFPDPAQPYSRISIVDKHAPKKRKAEIPVAWIRDRWLKPGAFDGLEPEARDVLLISLETGCRQSEIYNLPPAGIVLDAPVPHIEIAFETGPHRREVKNVASLRQMPLVGLALAAARRHPNGFPKYRGKSSYSAEVNGFLRDNGLVPPKGYTAGGLRHTWESRWKMQDLPSDDRAEMMGHSVGAARNREVYGDPMSLVRKRVLMLRVAFEVPEHLA
ncbi:hypothetical protein D1820_15635 [Phaeobacter sp. LSS9]|uniref:DUF6538 domain-containing protein n=1 Tax=Phaeobacter sp. LSS9 TaxID=681157 RepID=UPI000E519B24|nr:DUF6538 domain-containing protein [Phaeobacter sp. LSS9]AXT36293.1 hypothetical protein D1820_15635 [Phaeobacter sp. LSS9]